MHFYVTIRQGLPGIKGAGRGGGGGRGRGGKLFELSRFYIAAFRIFSTAQGNLCPNATLNIVFSVNSLFAATV